MHRVRVGLTGLACVFLLVLLATALLHMAERNEGEGAGNHATGAHPAAAVEPNPPEPLAQLGVAPGNPAPSPPTGIVAQPARH